MPESQDWLADLALGRLEEHRSKGGFEGRYRVRYVLTDREVRA